MLSILGSVLFSVCWEDVNANLPCLIKALKAISTQFRAPRFRDGESLRDESRNLLAGRIAITRFSGPSGFATWSSLDAPLSSAGSPFLG